jgi:hypothetical protein
MIWEMLKKGVNQQVFNRRRLGHLHEESCLIIEILVLLPCTGRIVVEVRDECGNEGLRLY